MIFLPSLVNFWSKMRKKFLNFTKSWPKRPTNQKIKNLSNYVLEIIFLHQVLKMLLLVEANHNSRTHCDSKQPSTTLPLTTQPNTRKRLTGPNFRSRRWSGVKLFQFLGKFFSIFVQFSIHFCKKVRVGANFGDSHPSCNRWELIEKWALRKYRMFGFIPPSSVTYPRILGQS